MIFNKKDFISWYLLKLFSERLNPSLDRMKYILEKFGNPHLKIPPVIHIAGTNGKGSTAAYLKTILEASGYKTHVYTSPHLMRWEERYQIGVQGGSHYIKKEILEDVIKNISRENGQQPITAFEVLTVAAFLIFSNYQADITIIEVGLGGRFDATNVLKNIEISLIMSISLDHQNLLGNKIEDIAFEKAGIIKEKTPVVIGFQKKNSIYRIFEKTAKNMNSPISVYGKDYISYKKNKYMIFENHQKFMKLPIPNLFGYFQLQNAAAAIQAISFLNLKVKNKFIKYAMKNVSWPGRMQKINEGIFKNFLSPKLEIWIDGGHNEDAGKVSAKIMKKLCKKEGKKLILICGMIKTKNFSKYIKKFNNIASFIYTVPIQSDISYDPQFLSEKAISLGFRSKPHNSILDILKEIKKKNNQPTIVLICGSLYLVGEALKINR